MELNLLEKVNRVNELYSKGELNQELSENEIQEQMILREELIEYFNFAINKHSKSKDFNNKGNI